MIVLHQHKLIFLKTRKTAGTSIEVFLGKHRRPGDIITAIDPPIEGHMPQNQLGFFNPLTDARPAGPWPRRARTIASIVRQRRRYYNHMPAHELRRRLPSAVWTAYRKIAVERNPWDKTVSMYRMLKHDRGRAVSLEDVIDHYAPLNAPIYIDPVTGDQLVDDLVHYETLTDGLARIFEEVGIPFSGDLGILAKGGNRKKKDDVILSAAQALRIETHFAQEIALMGYTQADAATAIAQTVPSPSGPV
ncbi:MAG: hypothetical protein AAFQ84_00655 [Pseudomonadota bacterium]